MHLLEVWPKLRRLLLPSRSQPCLGHKIIELTPCLAVAILFPNSASKQENVHFPPPGAGMGGIVACSAELSLCRARVQLRVPGCLRGQGAAGPACPAGPVQAAAAFALNFPVSMA